MKLHLGPEWCIFHILTSENIDDVISRSFTVVCSNKSVKNGEGKGRDILNSKILEAKYEAKLEYPRGRGVQNKKPSMGGGGSVDIFWNCTIFSSY